MTTRIVFLGSGELACASLLALARWPRARLSAVFSQPDKPKGRGGATLPCQAALTARNAGLPLFTPPSINADSTLQQIRELNPDIIVVAAYGQILKQPLLDIPPLGCINVHGSILPKLRGAAPVQWAIANGNRETGITTLYMNSRMDAGDIILQAIEPILESDNAATLMTRLAQLGAQVLIQTLDQILADSAPRLPQVEADATFAPKLSKNDGKIDWTTPAIQIANRVRGFNPWPMCHTTPPNDPGKTIRVLEANPLPHPPATPGILLANTPAGPLIATGHDALCLTTVQPEGKNPMSGAAYVCGRHLQPGAQFS